MMIRRNHLDRRRDMPHVQHLSSVRAIGDPHHLAAALDAVRQLQWQAEDLLAAIGGTDGDERPQGCPGCNCARDLSLRYRKPPHATPGDERWYFFFNHTATTE